MHYITYNDLKSLIPPDWLLESLDDDNDGTEESFEGVRQAAEDGVNGVLSTNHATPIANPEAYPFLRHITRYHAAWICYARRGYDYDKFPHKITHEPAWKQLTKIGEGDLPLGPATGGNTPSPTKPRGSVITGPARTHSSNGSFTA